MSENLDVAEIREAIRKRYAEVARTAEGKFNYPTGKTGALKQGYNPSFVDAVPEELIESFCGVGNPFSLGPVLEGESFLDIGCGAGFDLVYASRLVGPRGKVCGIDLTEDMADKARKNLKKSGASPFQVLSAGSEDIPFPDASFDVVTSNGVLNLSPSKEKSFREIYRVLKQGGRLQFADIVVKEGVAPHRSPTAANWSD